MKKKLKKKPNGGKYKEKIAELEYNLGDEYSDKAMSFLQKNYPKWNLRGEGEDDYIDALRHSATAMYMTKGNPIRLPYTNAAGLFHELYNPNPIKQTKSDLYNNLIGSLIGSLPISQEKQEKLLLDAYNKDYLSVIREPQSQERLLPGQSNISEQKYGGKVKKYPNGGQNSIEGDLYSKLLLLRNKDKSFVERGLNPNLYPVQYNPDMSYSTHQMGWGEDNKGQSYMFPTIFNESNEYIKVPNQYADYISEYGYKNALNQIKEEFPNTSVTKKHGGMAKNKIHIKPSKRGSLHKHLGIPEDEKIPLSKLKIKDTDSEAVRKKKQFALNARKWKENGGYLPEYFFGGMNFSGLGDLQAPFSMEEMLNPQSFTGTGAINQRPIQTPIENVPQMQQTQITSTNPSPQMKDIPIQQNPNKQPFNPSSLGLQNMQPPTLPAFNPTNSKYWQGANERLNKALQQFTEAGKSVMKGFGMGKNGKLLKYPNGGQNPPIYTSDPNDPRLQAYQDSLEAYKYGVHWKDAMLYLAKKYPKVSDKQLTELRKAVGEEIDRKHPKANEKYLLLDTKNVTTGLQGESLEQLLYEPIPPTQSILYKPKSRYEDEYNKKYSPIYLTNPDDPRIGSYSEVGNQYLYKAPQRAKEVPIQNVQAKEGFLEAQGLGDIEKIPFTQGTYFTRDRKSQEEGRGKTDYFDKKTGKLLGTYENGGIPQMMGGGWMAWADAIAHGVSGLSALGGAGMQTTKALLDTMGNANINQQVKKDEANQFRQFALSQGAYPTPYENYGFGTSGRNPAYAENGMTIKEIGGKGMPNIEVEHAENILLPNGFSENIYGNTHAEGGEKLNLPIGTKVFSEKLKDPYTKKSYAKMAKKFETKKDFDNLKSIYSDKINKETSELNIALKNRALDNLFLTQEQDKLSGKHGKKVKNEALSDYMKHGGMKKAENGVENLPVMEGLLPTKPLTLTENLPLYENYRNFPTVGSIYENIKSLGYKGEPEIGEMQQWAIKNYPEQTHNYMTNVPMTNKGRGIWEKKYAKKYGKEVDVSKMSKKDVLDSFGDNLWDYRYPNLKQLKSPSLWKKAEGAKPSDKVQLDKAEDTFNLPFTPKAPNLNLTAPLLNIYPRDPITSYELQPEFISPRYLDIQPQLQDINRGLNAFTTNLGDRTGSSISNLLQAQANVYEAKNRLYGQKYNYDRQQDLAAQEFNAQSKTDVNQANLQNYIQNVRNPQLQREAVIQQQKMIDERQAAKNQMLRENYYQSIPYIEQMFNPYQDSGYTYLAQPKKNGGRIKPKIKKK